MKKTNVMVEVSDEIYDSVVVPYKQRKSFGKLVTQLLEAYATNDSVYNYINGVMDGLEEEATEELLRDLNSMAQSLSMMSMLGSQAEAVIDSGKRDFEEVGSKAEDDFGKYGHEEKLTDNHENNTSVGLTKEDVVVIVENSISDIRDMLKQVLSSGVRVESAGVTKEDIFVTNSNEPKNVSEEVISPVNNFTPIVEKEYKEIKFEEDKPEVSKEDEEKAQNALSSLMGSLSF